MANDWIDIVTWIGEIINLYGSDLGIWGVLEQVVSFCIKVESNSAQEVYIVYHSQIPL